MNNFLATVQKSQNLIYRISFKPSINLYIHLSYHIIHGKQVDSSTPFLTFLNDDIKAAGMADEDICLPIAPRASFPHSVTSGLLLINVTTPSSGGGAVGGCGARNAGRVEQTVGDSLPCSNVDIGRHFDFNVGGSRIA